MFVYHNQFVYGKTDFENLWFTLTLKTIPAEPGPGQNKLILARTGIFPGIPVDPYSRDHKKLAYHNK